MTQKMEPDTFKSFCESFLLGQCCFWDRGIGVAEGYKAELVVF